MGESKLPKTAALEPVRPVMSLIRLKAAISSYEAIPPHEVDKDTRAYMADLSAVVGWLEHLEAQAAPVLTSH